MTKKPPTKEQLEKYKETINLKYKNDPEFRKKNQKKERFIEKKIKKKFQQEKKKII